MYMCFVSVSTSMFVNMVTLGRHNMRMMRIQRLVHMHMQNKYALTNIYRASLMLLCATHIYRLHPCEFHKNFYIAQKYSPPKLTLQIPKSFRCPQCPTYLWAHLCMIARTYPTHTCSRGSVHGIAICIIVHVSICMILLCHCICSVYGW
jgi:hypothetical protein